MYQTSFSNGKGPIVQELLQRAPDIAKGAMGAPFVDFVFRDTSGVKHALSEFVGKGKYLLVMYGHRGAPAAGICYHM